MQYDFSKASLATHGYFWGLRRVDEVDKDFLGVGNDHDVVCETFFESTLGGNFKFPKVTSTHR